MKQSTFIRTRLFLAASLALAGSTAFAQVGVSPDFDADYALLPKGSIARGEQGFTLVHDYGAFALWRVAAAQRARAEALHPVASLADRSIDTPAGAFTPGAADNPAAASGTTVFVVQFVGPITDAWLDKLRAAGATPLQYVNNNAYLVLADARAGAALADLARTGEPLRYSAPLVASQKLTAEVSRYASEHPSGRTRLTVVVAAHANVMATQNFIAAMSADTSKQRWVDLKGMYSLDVDVPIARVGEIAARGDVLTIGLAVTKHRLDEKQAQIMAGHFNPTQSGPSAPGYRNWLTGLGFSTNPADYPVVAVVDDGVGNGTTTAGAGDPNFTSNGAGIDSRVVAATSCTSDSPAGIGGHGNINASIAVGYDDRSGFPNRDPDGFRRREGINPFGRVANVQIFGDGDSGACGTGEPGVIALQASQNVRISSNSWGLGSIFGPATGYIAQSREYDIGVRDADQSTAGNQEIAFIFAAGNDGPDPGLVSAPGNAKNTLVVGASENQRSTDEDGPWSDTRCATVPTDADNAMEVADYSSRGPAVGGRAKPEVIAPGTHIQGGASVAAGADGSSVCDRFRPSGQTEVAGSTGTSHSTPAVSGAATLIYRHLQSHYAQAAPSAALIKGYFIAHPTYLTGTGGNDTLPSFNQGYGMPNLAAAFDPSPTRVIVDQTETFADTGDAYQLRGAVADSSKPVRIVLTWTDAPAAVNSTAPAVNNLNLTATVGGVTYVGNRFNGQWSNPAGGAADAVNNTEVIFLPPGTSGAVEVNVTAANIAGDGVPGNADTTDQDFALVCNNCSQNPDFFVATSDATKEACGLDPTSWSLNIGAISGYTGNVTLSASALPGTKSAFSVPSGTAPFHSTYFLVPDGAALAAGDYAIQITGTDSTHSNTGNLTLKYSPAPAAAPALTAPADDATNVSVLPTLTWAASPGAVDYTIELDDDASFGSIDATATVTGTSFTPPSSLVGLTTYHWRVRANNHCGSGSNSPVFSFTTQPLFCATPGTAIPDNSPTGVTIPIVVPNLGALTDLDVSFATNHTWAGDLTITLTKGSTTIDLMNRPGTTGSGSGCQGNNANLVFDDEGTAGSVEGSCSNNDPAYSPPGGHFTPNMPLSTFDGIEVGGTWNVKLTDAAGQDTGVVQNLCLIPTYNAVDPDVIFRDGFEP